MYAGEQGGTFQGVKNQIQAVFLAKAAVMAWRLQQATRGPELASVDKQIRRVDAGIIGNNYCVLTIVQPLIQVPDT